MGAVPPGGPRRTERLAREQLDEQAWAYLARGSGDEHTLRANEAAWAAVRLVPHVLRDVSGIDTHCRLLGHDLASPLLLAPTAAHGLFHPGAEAETARGAAAADVLAVHSSLSTLEVGQVAAASSGPWWFQAYVHQDRAFVRDLVQRAVSAGASALVVTVDLPVRGAWDSDRREERGGIVGAEYANLRGLEPPVVEAHRVHNPHHDARLTWSDLEWLRSAAGVPLLLKGILRGDDAVLAVEHGADGVIVSNHGGRALDTVPATAEALPGVLAAVAGRMPVLVDGGIRRGVDIATALSMGASAVLVGRPYVWGLAVGGADGVRQVVEDLRTELEMAMGMLGAATLADLSPDLLWKS
ncbi:MAG: alpha-hydroxy acid oxidase [Actinomycetes bacterium]